MATLEYCSLLLSALVPVPHLSAVSCGHAPPQKMPTGSCELQGHLEIEGCDNLRLQERKIPPMLTVKGS